MAAHVQTRAQPISEPPIRIRLICLACSRAQLAQYRRWAEALSESAELIAVDLPPSAFQATSAELARSLAERLRPYLETPHALFGQSQGALAALALAQLAQRIWPSQTRHLFVAGCDSPNAASRPDTAVQVPMTVVYPPGALATMLGWNPLAGRGLELIELAASGADDPVFSERIVRIFNTHLGLLSL